MLKPVISQFECDDDILGSIIKLFFLVGKDRINLSEDFLAKQICNILPDADKFSINNRIINTQPFSLFYKYLNMFVRDVNNIASVLGHHVEFKYNRKSVWNIIKFLIQQTGNYSIRKNVVINYLKNNEDFFDNENLVSFIENIIKDIDDNIAAKSTSLMTIGQIEIIFFFLSKTISIYNFIQINNHVADSVSKIVVSDELSINAQVVSDIYNIIDDMSKITYDTVADELILDGETIEMEMDNLNYPIVSVSMFDKQRLFQEKRVYMFVGPSGIGKSMLLSHITAEMWLNSPYKKAEKEAIFYFTMENLKQETGARILANAFYRFAGINKTINDILLQKYSADDKNVIKELALKMNRIVVVDYLPPRQYGVTTYRNIIKRIVCERGVVPYAIIVDFLDKMKTEKKNITQEHQELGEIIDELKWLSGELSVPIITVSHLNAAGIKMIKDNIEQLAGGEVGKSLRKYESCDVVAFMDEEDTGLEYNVMNMFFSKHRYHAKNMKKIFTYKFIPEYSFFGSLDKEDKKEIKSVRDIEIDDYVDEDLGI